MEPLSARLRALIRDTVPLASLIAAALVEGAGRRWW